MAEKTNEFSNILDPDEEIQKLVQKSPEYDFSGYSKETPKLNYAKVEPIVERLDKIDKTLEEIKKLIIGLQR